MEETAVSRKAKIVATIGPASQSEAVLEQLLRARVNVARLNFSHGTHAEHAANIAAIRRIAKRLGAAVGILQDLQGPKIRVGALDEPLHLVPGETVRLYAQGDQPPAASGLCVPIDFPELFASVSGGDRILLDDGRLGLTVAAVCGRSLAARVDVGGLLSSHKGINLPGVRLDVPAFTEKDEADLAFGLSQGVDAVAVSFVRSAQDVAAVRAAVERLAPDASPPLLIAKLERPEALENLDAILQVADGAMVARGDLGVEMPPENVPIAQKRIIQAANHHGNLVITATQMLDSMVHNVLPTRAEASDVANAIFDGTDAVMLSGETAVGEHPLEAVAMMDRIVAEAEAHFAAWGHGEEMAPAEHGDAASLARAVREIAHDRAVAAIAVFTQTGRTAWLMSKMRPRVPILAFTPQQNTYRRMAFLWGVASFRVPFANTMEKMLGHVEAALYSTGFVQPGQQVVLVCGFPLGAMRPPNMALLHTVGERL